MYLKLHVEVAEALQIDRSNPFELLHCALSLQVYLELHVEVAKGWRENKQALEQYGYFDALYT